MAAKYPSGLIPDQINANSWSDRKKLWKAYGFKQPLQGMRRTSCPVCKSKNYTKMLPMHKITRRFNTIDTNQLKTKSYNIGIGEIAANWRCDKCGFMYNDWGDLLDIGSVLEQRFQR